MISAGMRRALLCLLVAIGSTTHAQWVRTNGPSGNAFSSIITHHGALYGVAENLFRSSDQGIHWEYIPVQTPYTSYSRNVGGAHVYSTGSRLVLIGAAWNNNSATGGIQYSDDDGAHWNDAGEWLTHFWFDKLVGAGDFVVASGMQESGVTVVYQSHDGGTHWVPLGMDSSAPVNAAAVVGNCLFVITDTRLYRSTDGGTYWSRIDRAIPDITWQFTGMIALHDTLIVADPSALYRTTDSGTTWSSTYVSGDSTYHRGAEFFGLAGDYPIAWQSTSGFFVSRDRAATWDSLGFLGDPTYDPYTHVLPFCGSGDTIEVLNPNNSNECGLFTSHDTAHTWKCIADHVALSSVSEVEGIDSLLLAVASGTVLQTNDGGESWKETTLFPGANTIVRLGTVLLAQSGTRIWRSYDSGLTWTFVKSSNGVLTSSGSNLLLSKYDSLFISLDSGTTWKVVVSPDAGSGSFSICAVDSILFAFKQDFPCFRSVNAGRSWTPCWIGIYRYVNMIRVVRGVLYAMVYDTGRLVYRSFDRGLTWELDSSGPAPRRASFSWGSRLFFVDSLNTWFTPDTGGHWYHAWTNTSMPDITCYAVVGDVLYGGTAMYGVWKRDLRTVGIHDPAAGMLRRTPLLTAAFPNPFSATTAIHYRLEMPGRVTIVIADVLGRILETIVTGESSAGDHSALIDCTAWNPGAYLVTVRTEMQATSALVLKTR